MIVLLDVQSTSVLYSTNVVSPCLHRQSDSAVVCMYVVWLVHAYVWGDMYVCMLRSLPLLPKSIGRSWDIITRLDIIIHIAISYQV